MEKINALKLWVLWTLVFGVSAGTYAAPSENEPNVILILADDLGYGDVGCYGCPDIKTPKMDKLAAQGVRCTSGYAAFPVCSPSRAALLTDAIPHGLAPPTRTTTVAALPNWIRKNTQPSDR